LAPPWLILYVQLTYLPAQDSFIRGSHQLFWLLDVSLVAFVIVPSILQKTVSIPFSLPDFVWGLISRRSRRWSFSSALPESIIIGGFLCISAWIAFFIAVFPYEESMYPTLTRSLFMTPPDPLRQGPGSWFSNRLVLPDQILGSDPERNGMRRS